MSKRGFLTAGSVAEDLDLRFSLRGVGVRFSLKRDKIAQLAGHPSRSILASASSLLWVEYGQESLRVGDVGAKMLEYGQESQTRIGDWSSRLLLREGSQVNRSTLKVSTN